MAKDTSVEISLRIECEAFDEIKAVAKLANVRPETVAKVFLAIVARQAQRAREESK